MRRATAFGLYLVLTEFANRRGGAAARQDFRARRKELADAAGLSVDTLDRYVAAFVKLGLLAVRKERVEGVHLPNRWALLDPGASAPRSRAGAARVAAGVRREVKEENLEGETTSLPAEPPKAVLIDGRNLGFDALADVCGIDTRNRTRAREIAASLKDVRAYVAADFPEIAERGEAFERKVADEVRRRATLYRRSMKDAALTPPALAKWWHDVERGGAKRTRPTAADFPDLDEL